jgi:hypothetical protein
LPDPSLPRTRRFQKRRGEILEWLQGIEDEDDSDDDEYREVPVDEPTDLHWAEQQLREWLQDTKDEDDDEDEYREVPVDEPIDLHWAEAEQQLRDLINDRREESSSRRG